MTGCPNNLYEAYLYIADGFVSAAVRVGTGDLTRWLYDGETGLFTNKVYAEGSRVVYTYTAAGRLATRAWVRVVLGAE